MWRGGRVWGRERDPLCAWLLLLWSRGGGSCLALARLEAWLLGRGEGSTDTGNMNTSLERQVTLTGGKKKRGGVGGCAQRLCLINALICMRDEKDGMENLSRMMRFKSAPRGQ